jgi:hypothetical protein
MVERRFPMNTRFLAAMAVYAAIAVLATFTLDGNVRIAVWILMGALALKTLIAYKARW